LNAADRSTVARYEYDPYGNIIGPDVDGDGQWIDDATAFALANPIRFSTKWYDNEFGKYYYGYRYYDVEYGRWINKDPIGELGGLNLYGLLNNDPIGTVDLLGHADSISSTYSQAVAKLLAALATLQAAKSCIDLGVAERAVEQAWRDLKNITPGSGDAEELKKWREKIDQEIARARERCKDDATCPRPPGDCPPDVYKQLADQIDKSCAGQARCSSKDDDGTLLAKLIANLACAGARNNMDIQCFRGGNSGHQRERVEAARSANNCWKELAKRWWWKK